MHGKENEGESSQIISAQLSNLPFLSSLHRLTNTATTISTVTTNSGRSSKSAGSKSAAVASAAGLSSDSIIGIDSDSTDAFVPGSIWDDIFVTKVFVAGKPGWSCGHCGKTFKPQHAICVIAHMLKLKGYHIAGCKAIIPMESLRHYRLFRQKTTQQAVKKSTLKRANDAVLDLVEGKQASATALLNGDEVCKFVSILVLIFHIIMFIHVKI